MASSSPVSHIAQNPFFAPLPSPFEAAPARDAEGPATYAMIPCGPAVDAEEVETAATAIEVVVRWEDTVLHIGHLCAGRSFIVGETADADLVVPADRLGCSRMPVVLGGAETFAVLPAGAAARLTAHGKRMTLEEAAAGGLATPSAAAAGATQVRIANGTRVAFEMGGLSFEIAGVHAGRKVAGRGSADKKPWALVALSTALHGALLATMFHFMPVLADTDEGQIPADQAHLLAQVLKAQAEKDMKEQEEQAKDAAVGQQGGGGDRAPGEPGKMGSSIAKPKNAAYAVQGSERERQLSRREALQVAESFGMVNILADLQETKNAPTSPWGDVAKGMDPISAKGNMWGPELADAYGDGGLDLSGTGEGAGGRGFGVGLGPGLGAGHGFGTCLDSNCQAFGKFGGSTGLLPSRHKTSDVKMRPGGTEVSGRIPPEVIQRVVRQNFGRFRACYETGLRNNPSLQGRISVAFVVGRDGAVGSANSAGSDLPDAGVVSCVVKQFYGLSFPAPEDGVVRVTYPIMFTPG